MGIVILIMTIAILSLLIVVALLMRRLKIFSAVIVNLNTPNPLSPARWSGNRAYNTYSETCSLDTEGYEIVSEAHGTTLSKNKAYDNWLPTPSRSIGQHLSPLVNQPHSPLVSDSHGVEVDSGDSEDIQLQLNVTSPVGESYDDTVVIGNQGANMGAPSDYFEAIISDTANENPAVVAEETGNALVFENPLTMDAGSNDDVM